MAGEGGPDARAPGRRTSAMTKAALSGRALAAEILGQPGCGALHRVSVGLRVVMAAAVNESVLRIRVGDEPEGTAGGGRGESARGSD